MLLEKSIEAVSAQRDGHESRLHHGASIALACRAFIVSESCYRYERKLNNENTEIADWLIRLTSIYVRGALALVICILATSKGSRGTTNASGGFIVSLN